MGHLGEGSVGADDGTSPAGSCLQTCAQAG